MARYESIPQSGTRAALDSSRGDRVLRYAAVLFAAGLLVHGADHFRRGLDVVTTEVFWAGNVTTVVAVVAIALVFLGNRWAPLLAVAVGFSQAIGVAAVHLPPGWGAFSDSLADSGVDALSWAAVLVEIAGAAAFGTAGVYALRRDEQSGVARGSTGTRSRIG